MKTNQLIGLLFAVVAIGVVTTFLSPQDTASEKPTPIEQTNKVEQNEPQAPIETTDFNDPARYAFVTDKLTPQLAVVDMFSRTAPQHLPLKTIAERIGISKTGGFIAYAKRGGKAFYQLNLSTLEQTAVAVKQPINDLLVHGDGKWVTYSSDDSVHVVTLHSGEQTRIETQGKTSILYHPSNDSLFIAELERGRLRRITLENKTQQTLFDLATPMSPISVMPNGMAIFFVADGMIQRYSLLDEEIIPLHINSANFRPYITSDSRMVLALTQQPTELLAINTYTYKVESRFALKNWQQASNSHDFVVTGWLERAAVLIDEQNLYTLSFKQADSLTTQENVNNTGAVRNMLVQLDSKTLLLTREGSQKLGIFDIKMLQFNDSIALDLTQPDQVIMGETNTLCH